MTYREDHERYHKHGPSTDDEPRQPAQDNDGYGWLGDGASGRTGEPDAEPSRPDECAHCGRPTEPDKALCPTHLAAWNDEPGVCDVCGWSNPRCTFGNPRGLCGCWREYQGAQPCQPELSR